MIRMTKGTYGLVVDVDGRELIVTKASKDMGLIEAALSQNRTM